MLAAQVYPRPMEWYDQLPVHAHHGPSFYAIPARRDPSTLSTKQHGGFSYAQHELMRQRKTPRGRLLEEHETAVLDRNVHIPATKHLILSRPPPPSVVGDGQIGHERVSPTFLRQPGPSPIQQHGSFDQRPAWDFPGGVDSVLHQNVAAAPTYHYHPEPHVPTALPSMLHPRFGPTASVGQDFYGPYWGDGSYNPYRPAPVRDARFLNRTSVPPRHSLSLEQRAAGIPTDLQHSQYHHHHHHHPRHPYDQLSTPRPADGHSRPYAAAQPSHLKQQQQHQHQHQASDLYPYLRPTHDDDIKSTDTIKAPSGLRQPLKLTPASDKLAFRDRTFTWAHHVYDQLLRLRNQRHSNSKPSTKAIFPKPPRRLGAHFRDDRQRFGGTRNEVSHGDAPQFVPFIGDFDRPPTAIPRSPPGATPRIQSQVGSAHPSGTEPGPHRAFASSDAAPPSTLMSPAQLHHISANAASALETMELLCREAETPWTDGMLLAGCLAYGLGNYGKAQSWYQSILAHDPQHVEAMSNLAATYLAVHQRDEAYRYWSEAVKLRPSYFEAVEHLIGLLSGGGRIKEALVVTQYVEASLSIPGGAKDDVVSDGDSDTHSRTSSTTSSDPPCFDYDAERRISTSSDHADSKLPGFGSSGYAVAGCDNGRLLTLMHGKANMLYSLQDSAGAATAFEDTILIAAGQPRGGMRGLIRNILESCASKVDRYPTPGLVYDSREPILLTPERAEQTARRVFPPNGDLPGLEHTPGERTASYASRNADGHQPPTPYSNAVLLTSNALLSLAKIYQDGMDVGSSPKNAHGTREILALYYLSLSLRPSASTANNVGILLAGVQSVINVQVVPKCLDNKYLNYTGVAPGNGVGLAIQYYKYGLHLDGTHAHLYTNYGSLLKDLGQLGSAIEMYQMAVQCDPKFDIALANLANAVKDQGRIADAIVYYKRAVQANANFPEAICGLATALNSVCSWHGRGGIYADNGRRDRIHVDEHGHMHLAKRGFGLVHSVVQIVEKQLKEGETWGSGTLTPAIIAALVQQLSAIKSNLSSDEAARFSRQLKTVLQQWSGKRWEGSRVVRLVEKAIRFIGWQWYQDRYVTGAEHPVQRYARPALPATLTYPTAPTVLPFHAFTTPLSAKQVRQISQRNALRISVSTLRSPWLPGLVYPPPKPPAPCLNVGYISSDFNNHPLAHLMQSIFGMHDTSRVRAFCYATTASDGSVHRQQIERETPVFYDASSWSVEKLVAQVVKDGIHVLVNLNGYTRGARNEVFAARPAPIHMSFMGFAGTLGAEWCDYVFADPISVSPKTLSPRRHNLTIEDGLHPDAFVEDEDDWVYAENVIFAKSTFFCADHKQSAPNAGTGPPLLSSASGPDRAAREQAWRGEQERRWQLRKRLFPLLPDSAVILGNFNQLYKIDPSTFRMYLRILGGVPNAILWLLRFPDAGEQNLLTFAHQWAGPAVASRIVFTDVAPKGDHITRASVVDLFLDTPECNAHTTAADVIWSGTPIVTWARWEYKMCSRMASSIVASALPETRLGDEARKELLVESEEQYEQQAICLASGLRYGCDSHGQQHGSGDGVGDGRGRGRLMDMRRMLWEGRWTSRLFDTQRWVRDLEDAYWRAWQKWVAGEGGDIWL